MFDALVHEGETVRLPSGRVGIVDGYEGGAPFGRYLDDDDEWQCKAHLLRHVSNALAGELVIEHATAREDQKVQAGTEVPPQPERGDDVEAECRQ